jgi:hypothetical protein
MTMMATLCPVCSMVNERHIPEAFNHYFYNPAMLTSGSFSMREPYSHMIRNKDVTVDIAVHQIEEILAMKKLTPLCPRCGVALYKTSQCNELSHCGVKKCNVCGRTTPVGGHLTNHWDNKGTSGCPQWDTAPYWKTIQPRFQCILGVCYKDDMDCTKPSHQAGIYAMHQERKLWHLFKMVGSLTDEKRTQVLEALKANTKEDDNTRFDMIYKVEESLYIIRRLTHQNQES